MYKIVPLIETSLGQLTKCQPMIMHYFEVGSHNSVFQSPSSPKQCRDGKVNRQK